MKIIDEHSFSNSPIKHLSIPSSVIELKDGWCNEINSLIQIEINKNEVENISNFNDTFIIGKSDLNTKNFDVLLFARRDIEHAVIPSFIKRISPYAFNCCFNIKKIDFSMNSELKSIGKYAFSYSSIEFISIPKSVIQIEGHSFSHCNELKALNFKKIRN